MKINKIKMIEQPKKEMLLDTEAMEELLGGNICGILRGTHCSAYSNGADCTSSTTLRCDDYAW